MAVIAPVCLQHVEVLLYLKPVGLLAVCKAEPMGGGFFAFPGSGLCIIVSAIKDLRMFYKGKEGITSLCSCGNEDNQS